VKVGIVIATYRRTGGLERVARAWARGLAARGHDVTVFAQEVEEADEGISFTTVGGARRPRWLRAATFPQRATQAVDGADLDVVCGFGATLLTPAVLGTAGPHRAWFEQGLAEAPALTLAGLRRRLNPHHRVVLSLEKKVFAGKRFERVYATSPQAAADFDRLYGVEAGVLPNGVDLDEFIIDDGARDRMRKAWDAGDRYVVLTIANEVARKGIEELIFAFAVLRREIPGALLVIGGDASGPRAARLARRIGVAEDIRFIGHVSDAAAAYAAADVFAFPTHYDPWGLVAVESLACGTPVVCGAAAGVAAEINDGETGIVVGDVRNPDALAGALIRAQDLVVTPEACRASIAHLGWDHIIDRVEIILDEVVTAKKAVR
jgi:UDP-glucose:(heptosyl)LPS alpha-1,3-glucosyltransferase